MKNIKYQDEVRANKFDEWVGERQTLKVIEEGVGDSILDIGCGIGQFTPMFLNKFKTVVGLDPSEKYLEEARRKNKQVTYVCGYGETFRSEMRFDTISMNNLLEHVDDPVALLRNCKKHLRKGGRVIAFVPNSNTPARRLGMAMGLIDSIFNISKKEKEVYGHQRAYVMFSLLVDARMAGLEVVKSGGLLYKPLPNEFLQEICDKRDIEFRNKFIDGLIKIGRNSDDCAQLYIICK